MANEAAGGCSAGGGEGGVEEAGLLSVSSSPKDRVKFLCSYGGKILPRPIDGVLKYVGGDTRVIAVDRDISLSELMKKISVEFEENMILKYQVMPEDLDVLVTVRTDEDLRHMLHEYDRQGSEGNPKLRTFLFPSNPLVVENQTMPMDPLAIEQRYIEAINGTIHMATTFRLPQINAKRPSFSLSTCSSPKSTSPESNKVDFIMPRDPTLMNDYHNSRLPIMHKVRSSPNLCCLNIAPHQSVNLSNQHLCRQHYHCSQHLQQHHPTGYQPSRPTQDTHRLASTLSFVRSDFARAPVPHIQNQSYSSRHFIGSGTYLYGQQDDHSDYVRRTLDRSVSVPQSPRSRILE